MNLEDGGSVKSPSGESERYWIPVQPGLFEYPVEEGQLPALLANRCTNCGNSYFPKRPFCPRCCEQGDMEEINLERRGIIYASTVVHIDSPAGIKAPYSYGYVDLPSDKLRVFALFTGADPFSFTPGQEVELVLESVRIDREGKEIIGYKFKPVSELLL